MEYSSLNSQFVGKNELILTGRTKAGEQEGKIAPPNIFPTCI